VNAGDNPARRISFLLVASLLVLTLLQCSRPFAGICAQALITSSRLTVRTHTKEEVASRVIDIAGVAQRERKDCAIDSELTPPHFDPAMALEIEVSFVRRVLHRRSAPPSSDDAFLSLSRS
jgi:hypothetical protein